jgi:hypothetical protein
VLSFDDTTQFQFRYRGGKIDPTSAVGVLLAFTGMHLKFPLAGTFYVLREPFAGVKEGVGFVKSVVQICRGSCLRPPGAARVKVDAPIVWTHSPVRPEAEPTADGQGG